MKVLLLNQCFWPDVVATAQQLTVTARGLAERGHEITVITSRHGYDDPHLRFARRERWNEIEIVRLPSIRLGKNSRWRRVINFASFSLACAIRLAIAPRQDVVVALTSPPLISWLASVFTRIKGGRLVFWVMDLNPDEAIAAGWLKPDSLSARFLSLLLKSSMRRAEIILALDHFMKDRIVAKGIPEEKIQVIPPSRDDDVHYDEQGREAFRHRHNLSGKFVVMYAGNHSPCHPLDTLLEAARKLKQRREIAFCFVGGGSELRKVKDFARTNRLENICWLPYQPQADLSALLSAADLHSIVMGEAFAGIVHPSKIYNILAIGSPFLYIGPGESHIGDLIARFPDGAATRARHGQPDVVAQYISDSVERIRRQSERYGVALSEEYSRSILLQRFVALVESVAQTSTCDLVRPVHGLKSVPQSK